MTIKEVLEMTDELKPNQYTEPMKIKWLSTVEGRLIEEIINPRNEIKKDIPVYTLDDKETKLLVPDPYSDIYINYLCMMIDFYNYEIDRYNNDVVMFNNSYKSFSDYYNRHNIAVENLDITNFM